MLLGNFLLLLLLINSLWRQAVLRRLEMLQVLSPPLVGVTLPQAPQFSGILSLPLLRQWGLRPRKRFRGGRLFPLLLRQ